MTASLRPLYMASVAAMLLACGNASGDAESLAVAQQALNACAETVPATRAVDGFPAYAQCAGIEDGAIWSNNGIDTASSSQGAGWVRTQSNGGYQCTEFARRYFMFHWGIDYQHGNAGEWCDGTLPSTLTLATVPTHGDLIVFAPGSCGADPTTGHIAVVDTVDTAGAKVTVVEQNQASRRSTQQSCGKCFLHAVKNDGSVGGASSGGTTSGGASSAGAAGVSSAGATGAGASSGGASSSAGSSSGGTSAASGSASGGAAVTMAGSANSSGAAPVVGSAGSSSAGSGSAGVPGRNNDANAADEASCSVGRFGTGDLGRSSLGGLWLAGAALLFRLGRRRRVLG